MMSRSVKKFHVGFVSKIWVSQTSSWRSCSKVLQQRGVRFPVPPGRVHHLFQSSCGAGLARHEYITLNIWDEGGVNRRGYVTHIPDCWRRA